ncbi:MAG TPA: hypothetical protein VMU77_07145, partial [Acidimicrobiales bacterium]|nr:hypothetical protein [Acidimicrobiales bacterium]
MSARNENGAQRPIQGAQESGNLLVVASLPEVAVGKPAPASTNRNNGNVQVERFLNREMSWLDFADRLLDIADDSPISLLERARFLAIFSGGMDEFFQVRVAGLKDQVAAGVGKRSPDGLTANEQLSAISGKVSTLVDRL